MKFVSLCFAFFLLTGCGGGGHSRATSVSVPTQASATDFQKGIFENSNTLASACLEPRTGTDPQTGVAFSDFQGTIEAENNWLRSWSNELYLWYDEIIDQDPALYDDPLNYFETLKSITTTPSGNPRDQFHFTYDTTEWNQFSESGVTSGYGMHLSIIQNTPPRDFIVSYVEPGSPADLAGIKRGSKILKVDGIDAITDNSDAGVDVINAGLFPAQESETHSFDVLHSGASDITTLTLVSANVTSTPVLKTEVISTATGNVGYLLFNDHIATAEAGLITAINQLKAANVSDLVLDLRYNGGGYLAIAAEIAYMIAGPAFTQNKVFELLSFNDKHPTIDPVLGSIIEPYPFIDETVFSLVPGVTLPSLNFARVFILTGADTCSASESIINGLRGINVDVIQIGLSTCGKPYGFYPQDNCGTTYFTIQFAGSNDIGFNNYPDGFSPQNTQGFKGVQVKGCSVADDFNQILGGSQDPLLSSALQFRETNACPAPVVTSIKPSVSNSVQSSLSIAGSEKFTSFGPASVRQNRILRVIK